MFDADQIVCLNGEFIPLGEAKVSVLDRGFIFGDGVYELIPVYAGEPFRMPHHLARLQRSLDGIGLRNPHTDAQWEALVRSLIGRQPFADQGVYFQVTRGVAKRDHTFPKDAVPTVFMMSNPLATPSKEVVAKGVAVVTAEDNRWHRCDLKTISLLGNVLMRQLAADHDAVETVMFRDGFLTEASASNVLVVIDGTIVVPPKDNLILPGITYDATMEFAREAGIPLTVRPVPRAEALAADEMWLSSSTKEVIAVTTVDGKPFAGGNPDRFFAGCGKSSRPRSRRRTEAAAWRRVLLLRNARLRNPRRDASRSAAGSGGRTDLGCARCRNLASRFLLLRNAGLAQSRVEMRLGLLQVRRFIRQAQRLEVGDRQAGLLFEQDDLFGFGFGGLALLRVGGDEVGVRNPIIVPDDRFFAGGDRVVVATERLVGAAAYGQGLIPDIGVDRESLVDPLQCLGRLPGIHHDHRRVGQWHLARLD